MPEPSEGETREEFISRCIPIVLEDGTAEDNKQAVAICNSMWEQKSEKRTAIKIAGDWELDVLGNPYGGPNGGKDSDGEFFSDRTKLHLDRFTNPLVVYYHGYGEDGEPQGDPEIIGRIESHEKRADGVWYRVILDKASEYARRVWDAAKEGLARASSGSISHLVRVATDGEILNWPMAELSLFDAQGKRQPANQYAVALPVMKSVYKLAGATLPDLPEEATEPQTEPQARTGGDVKREGAQPATTTTETPQGEPEELNIMDEKELQEQIQSQVAAALKLEREAREAEEKATRERQEQIDAAVKAEKEKWEAEAAKANRLDTSDAPNWRKHPDIDKYDDLTPGEHAFMIQAHEQLRRLRGGNPLPDAAFKALAMKAEAEAEKDPHSREAVKAMRKAVPEATKAYEINYSTYSSYGDQWVGVLYHSDLWEKIRGMSWVLSELEAKGDVRQIPQGFESDVVPLESADPTWYNVSQATAHDATSGRPVATITSSLIGTAQKAVTLGKIGCRVIYSGEMEEDSLIPWVSNAYRQIQTSGAERMDYLLIDGDTETSGTTNINDIGGTPTAGDLFLNCDGFRKLALVTNTANSRDGGALTVEDYLETVKLMGNAGLHAADPTKVTFIVDPNTYWKSLELDEVKTRDVFAMPTIENGMLTGLWGYALKRSYFMQYAGVLMGTVTTAGYMYKSNSSGKVDQDTEANNTKGAILAVRWDQWALRWKRRMKLEAQRWPEADASQIVATLRFGLGYRDTEASAISYNISV